MKKSTVYVIYVVALIDLFSASMVVVTLPTYLKNELGMSASLAGLVGSLYGFVQFFSGPLAGGWSDIFGIKLILFLCIVLCIPSYACLIYTSWTVVVVGRLLAGCFKHTQNLCRTFLAAHGDQTEQLVMGGRLNAMGNVGYVVGPALSALLLAYFGYWAVYVTVCSAFAFNALVVHFYLHADGASKHPSNESKDPMLLIEKAPLDPRPFLKVDHLITVIKQMGQVDWSRHWDLFLSRFLISFTVLLYRSSYNWLLTDRYAVSPSEQSYLSSYQGFVSFAVSMRVHRISRWLGGQSDNNCELTVILARFTLLLLISLMGLMFSRHFIAYVIFLSLLCLSTSVIRAVSVNATTARCENGEYGVVLGTNASLTSVARCLAPFFGGLLYDLNTDGTAVLAIAMTFLALIVTSRFSGRLQPKLTIK